MRGEGVLLVLQSFTFHFYLLLGRCMQPLKTEMQCREYHENLAKNAHEGEFGERARMDPSADI